MAKEWMTSERWGSSRKKVWEEVYVLVGDGTARERLGYAYGLLAQLQPDFARGAPTQVQKAAEGFE